MKYAPYWQGEDGLRNIKPNRGGVEFPEGFDVLSVLREIIRVFPVVDVGCGYGRLAKAFEPKDYLGLDCNRDAIEAARILHHNYHFHLIDSYDYPPSMSKLAYTVAMHIPDDEYSQFITALCARTGEQVVIAEILGHERRRKLEKKDVGWIQPTFGRNRDEHEREMLKHHFQLVTWHDHVYTGKNATFSFLDFRRVVPRI